MKKIFLLISTFIYVLSSLNFNISSTRTFREKSIRNNDTSVIIGNPCYEEPDEILYSQYGDSYERNNSFQSATILNRSNDVPRNYINTISGTLHYDPWYYLFWRDIDEDYYYFEVRGQSNIYIDFSNIPLNCNYGIEIYKFSNLPYPHGDSSIHEIYRDTSSNVRSKVISERFVPGVYYIRIYSLDGSYDEINSYSLSIRCDYFYSYNSASYYLNNYKGSIWLSSYDPFGLSADDFYFNSCNVGTRYTDTNGFYYDYYNHPFSRFLGTNIDNVYATFYLWDQELLLYFKEYCTEFRDKLIQIRNDGIGVFNELFFNIIDEVVSIFYNPSEDTETSMTIDSSTLINNLTKFFGYFFLDIDSLVTEDYIRHFDRLIDNTDDAYNYGKILKFNLSYEIITEIIPLTDIIEYRLRKNKSSSINKGNNITYQSSEVIDLLNPSSYVDSEPFLGQWFGFNTDSDINRIFNRDPSYNSSPISNSSTIMINSSGMYSNNFGIFDDFTYVFQSDLVQNFTLLALDNSNISFEIYNDYSCLDENLLYSIDIYDNRQFLSYQFSSGPNSYIIIKIRRINDLIPSSFGFIII